MKRLVSTLMATLLLASYFAVPVFAQESSDNSAQIDSLFEERAELICLEKWDEVESIDQQLESLGVEKLTAAEVDERFGSIDGATPYVSTPPSTNVTWFSGRINYTYMGTTYEIQTLTAQPNEHDSSLKKSGFRTLSSTYKWKVGFMNLVSVLVSSIPVENKKVALAMTVYEGLSGFVSGVSKTTEISSAEIVYSYAHTTTATFKYVKVKGQSDDYQVLSYISTKGKTTVGYQYPEFIYSSGSVEPNVVQGNRIIDSVPDGYNSNIGAIKAYSDPNAPRNAYLLSVEITGIEWKNVSSIYPVRPNSPTQLL